MRFLMLCYEKVLSWSQHPKAIYYLALTSFLDSSIFPISPMFMLIPMVFAKPSLAFRLAFVTTVASILGGIVGYGLGLFAFEVVMNPFIIAMGYTDFYQNAMMWFQKYGFWAVLLACFSPIPYKIFTIGAGVMQLNLGLFVLASTVGRALRFYLTSAIIRWGGPKMDPILRRILAKNSISRDG